MGIAKMEINTLKPKQIINIKGLQQNTTDTYLNVKV